MTVSSSIRDPQSSIRNLVECVPNFSEGRKPEVIETIAQAIASIRGVTVLNRHIDPDHNRSVITFVASPDTIVDAALRAVATAAQLIDLRSHKGEHPRIGATDVLPFVPVSGVTIEDCVALAHEAGKRIWNELSIPVFFYERAALRPERARLENVRGKGSNRSSGKSRQIPIGFLTSANRDFTERPERLLLARDHS